MVLLDGRRHDARHADAVAAHVHRDVAALFVLDAGLHGLAVLAAELEDVPDLDAAGDRERARALRAAVAVDDVAQVRGRGFRQVASPVDAREVRIGLVRAADEVRERGGRVVGDHGQLEPHGPEESRLAAEGGGDAPGVGHAQRLRHGRELAGFQRVQFVVAAQQQDDEAAVRALDDQRLEQARGRQREEFRDVGDGARIRCRDLAQLFSRGRARLARRQRLCELEVRGVFVAVRKHDRVLARVGEHVEFLRRAAADRAGVGVHRAKAQAKAREDRAVGLVHLPVALRERRFVGVEAVGVLHDEFARAHYAEAGADLVAELGLDLVEVDRQLAVALELAAGKIGDDFLVGRPEHHVAVVAVLEPQQLRPELLPAAGLDPQLRGLDDRHRDLEGARAIHLLADHALDLAQDAKAHGEPGIKAARKPPDEPGAQHEPVAHDLGFGRDFLDALDRIFGQAHGSPQGGACRRSQSAVS